MVQITSQSLSLGNLLAQSQGQGQSPALANQLLANAGGQASNTVAFLDSGAGSNQQGLLSSGGDFGSELERASGRDEAPRAERPTLVRDEDAAPRKEVASRSADERDRESYRTERRDDAASTKDSVNDERAVGASKQDEAPQNQRAEKAAESETAAPISNDQADKAPAAATAQPAEDVVSFQQRIDDVLKQLEQLAVSQPELASQLQPFIAAAQQTLSQLGGLAAGEGFSQQLAVGALGEGGTVKSLLAQLDQLSAQLAKLTGGFIGDDGAVKAGQENTAGLIKGAANNATAAAAGADIGKALQQFTEAGQNALQALSRAVSGPQVSEQVVANALQNSAQQSQAEQGGRYNATSDAANAELAAGVKTAGQQHNNNGQQATQDQAGNGQQQAFAQAQANAQTQAQNQASRAALRGGEQGGSNASLLGSSANTATAGQAINGAPTTSAVLSREAANFEQVLKQAGKPAVADQVQVQIKTMIKNGDSKVILKIDPPELGQLEIKMELGKNTKTQVVINVERVQTLELLQRDSRMLMQALADAGLQTDGSSLSFNLQGGNDSQSGEQRQAKHNYPAAEEQFDTEMLAVISENYVIQPETGVNIHA